MIQSTHDSIGRLVLVSGLTLAAVLAAGGAQAADLGPRAHAQGKYDTVQECQKAPTDSFWQKVKAEIKKIEGKS